MRSIDKKIKMLELKMEMGSKEGIKTLLNLYLEQLQSIQYYMDINGGTETQATRELIVLGFHASLNKGKKQ